MDPNPHGSGNLAWIRNSENLELDPDLEKIIPDPQHWLNESVNTELYKLNKKGFSPHSKQYKCIFRTPANLCQGILAKFRRKGARLGGKIGNHANSWSQLGTEQWIKGGG